MMGRVRDSCTRVEEVLLAQGAEAAQRVVQSVMDDSWSVHPECVNTSTGDVNETGNMREISTHAMRFGHNSTRALRATAWCDEQASGIEGGLPQCIK